MKKKIMRSLLYSILLICSYGYGQDNTDEQVALMQSVEQCLRACKPFRLESAAFTQGQVIPVEYTCDGNDISPLLYWSNPPKCTRSFALIMDDPDAPGRVFVHWVLFNIPACTRRLPKHVTNGNFISGRTDFNYKENGIWIYGGPCPPPGDPHRYFFKLYALNVPYLPLNPNATKADVIEAMRGHVIGQAVLMGTYQR